MKILRNPLLLLCLFVTTTLYADWQQSLKTSFDSLDALIVPPEARPKFLQTGPDPEHDYTGEVAALLKGNPDAPFLCAALNEIASPIRMLPQSAPLRAKELEMCKAYPFTPQQLDEVRKFLHPPPPPRREQIVMQLQGQEPLNRWFSGMGIYAPPPLDPMDWVNGNTQGRDYRKDLEADFDANPLRAATVCVSATRAHATTADAQKLLPILLDVCKAFPDSRIEAAFAAYKSNAARAWLTGLMNTFLDEAAQLSIDARRQQASAILAALPADTRGSPRFQSALHVVALTPDDWRGPAAVLRYVSQASASSPGGAQPTDVKAWMEDWYSKRSSAPGDVWSWKRGARGFYALTGQLDRARVLAKEIANHRDPQQHSLDVIYLAALDRAAGNRAAYDRLFADCPSPDPVYLQQQGKPARPVRYCEDVASEFARAVRDELRGAPAAAEFSQIAVETNRIAPASAITTGIMPPVDHPPVPSVETDDWFSAIVKRREENAGTLTRVFREQESALANPDAHSLTFEGAVQLLFLSPWDEKGVFAVLKETRSLGSSQEPDKPAHVRKLIHDLIERRAVAGPDAEEWKRALRAYYLFTADYTRARDLSRELIKSTEPRFAVRDGILLGLTERINGDRKPLDHTIATCPQPPKEALERFGLAGPFPPGDFCRSLVVWDISRSNTLLNSNVPNAYKDILREIGSSTGSDSSIRSFAVSELSRLDIDAADQLFRDVLRAPNADEWGRQFSFWGLATIAEKKKRWQEGIVWVDQYIEMFAPSNNSFTPELWKALAFAPEGNSRRREQLGEAYNLRLRLSIGARDFENAHRTIEDTLTFGLSDDEVQEIRLSLIQLAAAETANGQREEPLRILGYVARQPLNRYLADQLAAVRKNLGGAEPKREDTPWDSVPRKRRRINVVPAEAKSS